MSRLGNAWVILIIAIGLVSPAVAQQRGFDRAAMLRRLDTDGDGVLQRDEIPERMLPMFEQRVKAHGGDLAQGVKINEYVRQVEAEIQQFAEGQGNRDSQDGDRGQRRWGRGGGGPRGGGGGQWGEGQRGEGRRGWGRGGGRDGESRRGGWPGGGGGWNRSGRDSQDRKDQPQKITSDLAKQLKRHAQQNNQRSRAKKQEPAVPGFGTKDALPEVSGFGDPNSPQSNGKNVPLKKGVLNSNREQLRKFAKSALVQHDKNKNGVIDGAELEPLKNELGKADRNRDNILTVDEIVAHLANFSKQQNNNSKPEQGQENDDRRRRWGRGWGRSEQRSSDSEDETEKKSYRFHTPHERLPEGLPSWFTSRDRNGDGQVAMAEYSSYWTESVAAEFARFDLNGDGIVTPDECLDTIGRRARTGDMYSNSR